jgi:hypothetical protein
LLNTPAANTIDSTIADMTNQSTSFGKTENAAGCPHSLKLTVLPASIIDGFVGRNDRFAHSTFDGEGIVVFEVGVWERINRDATGEVTYSVSSHTICHNEQVTAAVPLVRVVAHSNLQRILIHGAPHPFVRARRILNGWR